MLHEKWGKRGTRNRGRYQVAQSWLNRLYEQFWIHDLSLVFLLIALHISESSKDQKFGCMSVNDLRHNY